ncbi:MAG: hypothetical protein K2O88_07795 [Paramuribaculum sp.]|nr:hypothetical protein [Paramuribaculum sp.]
MKTIYISIIATALMTFASILSGCSHLSSEAKEMVGCYFIPEVSQDDPLMELNANGSCVIRAVKPGVLTMSVPGTWNVLNDSLIVELDPSGLVTEGDSTLVGNIPLTLKKSVVDFNGTNLTLEYDGVQYVYLRRGQTKD